ncbi:MAG: 2-dehydropantoate 2-reductase [Bacteroidia bacterium]
MKVLYVGSGAVNLCLAGWMHSATSRTSFLVRSPENELIRLKAFQCLLPGEKNYRVYTCSAFSSLDGAEKPDLVVVGVKSYSLEEVLSKIENAFGNHIPVMSVLNGVNHIKQVSDKFPNALFATLAFNAYKTSQIATVAVGEALTLSSINPKSQILDEVFRILKREISVSRVIKPSDAAHCKLVFNLGNALLTIVEFHNNRSRDVVELQKIMASILWEGVQVLRKSGVKEARMEGVPPWIILWLSKVLPSMLVVPIFEKKMQASTINSMAQDLKNGSSKTELEDLNGYFLQMADKAEMAVPYNRALYHIFKEWLANANQPVRPSELLSRINSFSSL